MKLTVKQLKSRTLRCLREREKGAKHYETSDRLVDEIVAATGPGTAIDLGKFGTVLVKDRFAGGNKVFQPGYARRFELEYIVKPTPSA